MASIGASIVFLGLILLTFAVSRIHKLLGFWENRAKSLERAKNGLSLNGESEDEVMPREIKSAVRQLRLLTDRIGEPFSLPKLLEFSEKTGMKRSHAMANAALDAGIIVPDGTGYFTWDQVAFDKKLAE